MSASTAPRRPLVANVNDDEDHRRFVSRVLERAGFAVLEGATGADALALAARQPELIVLDVTLPDLGGFEVCRRIKAHPATSGVLVLHLSASRARPEDRVQGLEGGADGYLVQPVEPDELVATVHALLRLRRAELQAAAALRDWQTTVEALRDGLGLLDEESRVVRCNEAFARLLGKGRADVIGPRFDALVGGVPSQGVIELRRGEQWLRVSADPLPGGGGVRVLTDMSHAKRLEEALRQRADALAEKDRHKDEFLAMLAHELRNPLAAITTGIRLLESNTSREGASRIREVVRRQTRNLTQLVDDLVDVARLTRGVVELRRNPLDLGALVQDAVQARRSLMEARGLEVRLELPSGPVRLDADPARLEQVLANLLDNAAKYTEPGGRVTVSLVGRGHDGAEEAVLTVKDTGIGLEPEMVGRVFDLFSQADISLDRTRGGLGIGLTMVRRMVELHGGSVAARSAGLGKGSEFEVRFPAHLAEVTRVQSGEKSGEPRDAARRRVLIVEDNADAREMLRELLELWGYEVEVAADGGRGAELALAHAPDVALIDVGLPVLDGYEVARRIRADPRAAACRLIALTGYGGADQKARALQAGFDLHLVKPVDPARLERLLAGAGAEGHAPGP